MRMIVVTTVYFKVKTVDCTSIGSRRTLTKLSGKAVPMLPPSRVHRDTDMMTTRTIGTMKNRTSMTTVGAT